MILSLNTLYILSENLASPFPRNKKNIIHLNQRRGLEIQLSRDK